MPSYSLEIRVLKKSKARLFNLLPVKSFILNEPFEIGFQFRRRDQHPFPGGHITIRIDWYGGAPEYKPIRIPALTSDSWTDPEGVIFNVHAVGMGIVYCEMKKRADDGGEIVLYAGEREVPPGLALDGIPAVSWEDFSASYGLLVAAISLALLVVHDYVFKPSSMEEGAIGMGLVILFAALVVYLLLSRFSYSRKRLRDLATDP